MAFVIKTKEDAAEFVRNVKKYAGRIMYGGGNSFEYWDCIQFALDSPHASNDWVVVVEIHKDGNWYTWNKRIDRFGWVRERDQVKQEIKNKVEFVWKHRKSINEALRSEIP